MTVYYYVGISTLLGNRINNLYNSQGIECASSSLRIGIFTTLAVDNFDHNPSSTSARVSLHGLEFAYSNISTVTVS